MLGFKHGLLARSTGASDGADHAVRENGKWNAAQSL
jgi:hypothetical protein